MTIQNYICILFLLAVTVTSQPCSGQQENVWAFGNGAGLDFNSGSPAAIQTNMYTWEGSASVCDFNGRLLFYTDGSSIWNASGNVMPNGTRLTGVAETAGWPTSTWSTSQPAVIVPMPDSINKYYVFSLTQSEQRDSAGWLSYSIVDMTLNSGLGDVVQGRKAKLIDTNLSEKLIAIAGDDCNIWLVVHSKTTNLFKVYEITNSGISTVPASFNVGALITKGYKTGTIKVAPDRKMLASCTENTLELFSFNPFSGTISNNLLLDFSPDPSVFYYTSSFSPDNSKLYVNKNYGLDSSILIQYDLSLSTGTAIINSEKRIAKLRSGNDLKIGPDNQIYVGTGLAFDSLGAIQKPDLPGGLCTFKPNIIKLQSLTQWQLGMPNDVPVLRIKDTVTSRYVINACFYDSVVLHEDQEGWNYVWDNDTKGRDRTVYADGSYWVKYMGGSCVMHIDTFIVDFLDKPLSGAVSGCSQQNSYVWAGPGLYDTATYSYTWTDASGKVLRSNVIDGPDTLKAQVSGSYIVTIGRSAACSISLSIKLSPPDYNTSFTGDTILCLGIAAAFVNTSSGSDSYLWDFGDGGTSDQISPSHIFDQPGKYKVRLVGYPCKDTFLKVITVDFLPYAGFVMSDSIICEGAGIDFFPSYKAGADSLVWNFGDGTPALRSWQPQHAFDSAGRWGVTLTGKYKSCPDVVFTDTIVVYSYPRVDLGPDISLCLTDMAIPLSNNAERFSYYRYQWNNGDTTDNTLIRHHGIYTLTIHSDNKCQSTDSIEVRKDCYLDMPNAFTPDGDGVNDFFKPGQSFDTQPATFKMEVFNKWGQPVFKTSRTDGKGWDGKFNDVDQPAGVYIYQVEVKINEHVEMYNGNLTLIR